MTIPIKSPLVPALCLAAVLPVAATDGQQGQTTAVITTVAELQAMNDDLAGSYVLAGDIDASETATWNGGQGFVPIGSAATPFTGQFDGQLHTIHDLHINRPGESSQGLFGVAQTPVGATERCAIENLRLVDAAVVASSRSGTLIGEARNVLVSICGASGQLFVQPDDSSEGKIGGLIGNTNWGSEVEQCFSAVTVHAGSRPQVGGLIGYHRGVEDVTRLSNSYSRMAVLGTGSGQGNLVGDADGSEVDRCYSTGAGKALIGHNYRDPVITNSYWDSDTGPSSSPNGGTPKTTEAMMHQSTYVGWDFATVWQIIETETYPWFQDMVPVELQTFTVE